MDKMKREDDAKSLAERDARRVSKQKVQDKSRNLGNTSPTKSVPKQGGTVGVESKPVVATSEKSENKSEKSREEILAERELKKQAKLSKKTKTTDAATVTEKLEKGEDKPENKSEKTREEILAERELKKQSKLVKKTKTVDVTATSSETTARTESITKTLETVTISEKPVLSKAERREKQEAQRAAKAKLQADKTQKSAVQSTEKKPKVEKVEKTSELSVSITSFRFETFWVSVA